MELVVEAVVVGLGGCCVEVLGHWGTAIVWGSVGRRVGTVEGGAAGVSCGGVLWWDPYAS